MFTPYLILANLSSLFVYVDSQQEKEKKLITFTETFCAD